MSSTTPFPPGTFSDRYDPDDEFSLLADEAAEHGIEPVFQPAERVSVETDNGRTISAIRWGDAEPEVVFLHGAGLNGHTWDMTIAALGRPALAIDLPGHGHSTWRHDGDYRPATNAIDIGTTISALAPNARHIVGQSLGGLTALALLAARPALVRGLTLVDVSPGLRIGDATPVRDFLDGATSFDSPLDIVERAEAFGFGFSPKALRIGVLHNTRQADDGRWVFRHHFTTLPPTAPFDLEWSVLWPALEASHIPVRLLYGSEGYLPPDVVEEFGTRVPRATVVKIDGPHNLQEDAPAAVAAAL